MNKFQGVGSKGKTSPNQTASSVLENQYKESYKSNFPYCTDCALKLKEASGEGKLIIFSGKGARWKDKYDWGMGSNDFKVQTSQGVERFSYHSVYTDGKYIFDPFVSSKPIPKSNYLKMLKETNINGVSWRLYRPETIDPAIPQLRKGNY